MSPFSSVRSLVADLRNGFPSVVDAETRDEATGTSAGREQERLYALVQRHRGRVRQQTLVEETGWDESKVSVRLQKMEANRRVVRVETGREKIVALPESVPARVDVE